MISRFSLGGVKWKVVVDNKRLDDMGLLGLCEHSKSLITLYDGLRNPELTDQTLYHEVVHAILDSIGEYELSQNEKFVQQFAVLLHQFETSKK